jgi:hypothetical protein
MLKKTRWQWLAVAAVVLSALLLRAHHLSQVFAWLDETDFFNEGIYGDPYGGPPMSLVHFSIWTRSYSTNTWGWPAVVWMTCRLFGCTLAVARAPSVLVGTSAILLVFLLVYRLIPTTLAANRFFPAFFAATLCTVAMPQMEFSQRTYPYGATPFMAAALLLAHLEVLRVTPEGQVTGANVFRAVALYTAAGSLALCIHPSLGLLLGASVAFLAVHMSRSFFRRTRAERLKMFRLALGSGAIMLCAALLNAKNPKYGFRPYLLRYYHQPTLRSMPTLFEHAYDLATYHLNLFYNTSLYWPERLNGATLPLILLCVLGWILAVAGKFGRHARHLAGLGMVAAGMPAVLSLARVFPFGGVRQTLFLSPFFFVFTALGFYALRVHWLTRTLGSLLAALYLALWAFNLPRFYEERAAVYNAPELVQVWRENDGLPYYTRGCDRELRYLLRDHPQIPIKVLDFYSRGQLPKPPYLVISTHWPPLESKTMFAGFKEYLEAMDDKATLIMAKPPKHLESLEYSGSLYFPPNGLWIYKVTAR